MAWSPSLKLFASTFCALASLATSAASAQSRSDDDATAFGPWLTEGLPKVTPRAFRMPTDPDVRFIVKDGSRGPQFTDACESVAPGEEPIRDGAALPVGDGRELACTLAPRFLISEQTLQGMDGRFYCWKGAAISYRTVSDSRLAARVVPGAPGEPWSVLASSEEAWSVQPISFFGRAWPLWIEVSYQTIDVAPANGVSCDGVLR